MSADEKKPGASESEPQADGTSDGTMTFDYQLRPGVVERSNAIELMRMMGLDV